MIHYEMWTVVASTILCALMYTKKYKTENLKTSGIDKISYYFFFILHSILTHLFIVYISSCYRTIYFENSKSGLCYILVI